MVVEGGERGGGVGGGYVVVGDGERGGWGRKHRRSSHISRHKEGLRGWRLPCSQQEVHLDHQFCVMGAEN